MSPQRCPRLNTQNVRTDTLYGNRDFADVVRLRILGCGDYPESSRWVQCNHEGLHQELGGSESEKEM